MQLHGPMQMAQSDDQPWNGLSIKPIGPRGIDAKPISVSASF